MQENHFLLRFLKLRVIVNGQLIYPLERKKPVVIRLPEKHVRIVVTDGFHITQPLDVVYTIRRTYYFRIVCAIENGQLVTGLILTAVIYAMGLTSGILFLRMLSLVPIIYFLFLYYINRKKFIQFEEV